MIGSRQGVPLALVRRALTFAVVAAVVGLVVGCGGEEGGGAAAGGGGGETITIGYVGTLSGPVTYLGRAPLQGAELAVEQVNAQGGVNGQKLRIVSEDDQLDPSQAVAATQKVISTQNVKAIIGSSHSGMSLAMIPVTEAAKVVQISPLSANPQLTDPVRPYFYRLWNTDKNISQVIAKYATDNYERVGVLYETTAFGTGGRDALTSAFRGLGSSLVAAESFNLDAQDLTPQLKALQSSNAEAIIMQTQGPQAALAARQLNQLGYEADLIGHPGLAQPGFIELSKGAAEGTIVFAGLDRDKPKTKEFVSAFEKKFGQPPFSFYFATGYDAVMLIVEALKKVNGDISQLQAGMNQINGFQGVVGRPKSSIAFSENDHDGYGPDALIAKEVRANQLAPVSGRPESAR